ncbi:MAG TPA: acyloxyacyl hydrolase [Flavisolibacter sp.]|nr:acyloxyacyl hydrolase [Flavisolibacter sp.]
MVQAQETEPRRFKTSGAMVGFGNAFSDNTYYKIFYFAGDFSWSFSKPRKKDFLAWYAEPQVNPVRTRRPWDIEFGVNLGLRNYIKINEGLYLYQMIGAGPHYMSARLERQARGFIFSDNFAVGAFTKLNKKNLLLNLQFRMRHLSNANLKLPNRGINSYNFLVGLSKSR